MADKTDALAKTKTTRIAPRSFSLLPSSLGEAMEMANLIATSDFAPKDYKGKPGNIIIAVQMGADVGLKPMQALQNIAVINGRPSIYGDAALALVLGADVLEKFDEFYEGAEGTDAYTAVCVAKRKGWPTETIRKFSIRDAKLANLWGKAGPWTTYPKRMLLFRARGFTLRDVASDRLMGLILAEEAMDFPDAIDAKVISSEVVPSAQDILRPLPEAVQDSIAKAFLELKIAVPGDDHGPWKPTGLGIAKLNEYLAGDGVDIEAGATALLNWCRDEFSRRKTGHPRKAVDDNGKKPKVVTVAGPVGSSDAGTTVAPAVNQAPAPAAVASPLPVASGEGPQGARVDPSVEKASDARPAGAEAPRQGSGQVAPATLFEGVEF